MHPLVPLVADALEPLTALLAPPRCASCDEPISSGVAFCRACASTAERFVSTDPSLTAAFVYGGAIARAIVRLKYGGRCHIARPLGDLLWAAIEPRRSALRDAVVVPVPLHPLRLSERGYNQSTLVARQIARRLGAPLRALALVRTRDTARQVCLDRRSRASNVSGAFVARRAGSTAPRTALLVDDVRTTGATLRECERALRSAGTVHVHCAVVAQADG
jgi:ComF family protein